MKDSRGISTASRNLPAVTSSIMSVSRSISSSADSSQASQPQTGKGSMYHRPNRIRRPGNAVNTTETGAASGSFGVSLTSARARSRPLSSFSSKPNPSARSTSKSLSSRSMIANIAVCNGRNRSGLVTRPYAGSVRDASPVPYPNHPGFCRRFKCAMRAHRRAFLPAVLVGMPRLQDRAGCVRCRLRSAAVCSVYYSCAGVLLLDLCHYEHDFLSQKVGNDAVGGFGSINDSALFVRCQRQRNFGSAT